MAAPATTTRSTPLGKILEDGYSTKIAFARKADVSFWEKTVKPPGIDGGDPIDITTMHNTAWRTMVPRNLKTLTESTATVGYDPNVYNHIVELINQEGAITCHFSDGSKLDFFGYLRTFEPSDHSEGENPEATITITPTHYDPTNDVEAAPVLTSIAGT